MGAGVILASRRGHHDDGGPFDHGGVLAGEPFVIACAAAAPGDSGVGALDDPAARQDLECGGIATADDLDDDAQDQQRAPARSPPGPRPLVRHGPRVGRPRRAHPGGEPADPMALPRARRASPLGPARRDENHLLIPATRLVRDRPDVRAGGPVGAAGHAMADHLRPAAAT